jgi:hypothetical protein
MCQALLSEEYPRFQAFSAPDAGMDGYDSDSETIFQAYFPEQAPRRDKILTDLEKARDNAWACKRWVLLLPKNPTAPLSQWLQNEQQPSVPFSLEVWGRTRLLALLAKHPRVREIYFPTEWKKELKRVAKGKHPGVGDATPEDEMTPEQAEQLRQFLVRLAEEEATRKHRKPRGTDFQREYGEFNSHFHLSSYDRLPANKFLEARAHLEKKLYSRRNRDTQGQQRTRYVNGIKAIQTKLKIAEKEYRLILFETTGKTSTTEMDTHELHRAFDRFRYLQGLAEAENPQ